MICQKPGKKPVHDWRVAVKKLRSYLSLCNAILQPPEFRRFQSIKKLSRVSGRYRDLGMSLSLLQQFRNKGQAGSILFEKNLRSLTPFAREATKSAFSRTQDHELGDLSHWVHSGLSGVADEELLQLTERYCRELIREIKEFSAEFEKNAHRIRKLLKRLSYWLKTCPVNPLFKKEQMKMLDKILDGLGNWQDHFVLGRELKKSRKGWLAKDTKEYESAKELERVIARSGEGLLQEAKERTASLLVPKKDPDS